MHDSNIRSALADAAQQIVAALQRSQYVHPHNPIAAAMATLADHLNLPPVAIEQATRALRIDLQRPIGRYRGVELAQLGRAIGRYCVRDTIPTA